MHSRILWLNGTFGAGKTTTANALVDLVPDARLFDPEQVGFMLRRLISEPVDDFQDWPAWRALVAETAVQLARHYGGVLVAPMTLLRREYAAEIFAAIAEGGVSVRHVLLHAEPDELIRRIESDQVEAGARDWRTDHLPRYSEALEWLRGDATVVDTTRQSPAATARVLADLVEEIAA